jgi:hypothetical protein
MGRKEETHEEKRDRFLQESIELAKKPRWGYFSVPGCLGISDDKTYAAPVRVKEETDKRTPFYVGSPYRARTEAEHVPVGDAEQSNPKVSRVSKSAAKDDRPPFKIAGKYEPAHPPAWSSASKPTRKSKSAAATLRGVYASAFPPRDFPEYMPNPEPMIVRKKDQKVADDRPSFRVGCVDMMFTPGKELYGGNIAPSDSVDAKKNSENTDSNKSDRAPFKPAGTPIGYPIIKYEESYYKEPPRVYNINTSDRVSWKPPTAEPINPSPSILLSKSNVRRQIFSKHSI